MKIFPLALLLPVLVCAGLAGRARAENLEHLNQLLSTKNCPGCDLSGSGLVTADLVGANLAGANLVGANLSQANLTGANLEGANLSGASLNGANLTGANLSSANLQGTDLRNTYLANAVFTFTSLDTAYMQGARGVPQSAGTPDSFYGWGLMETNKGNYRAALDHFNKAIVLDDDYAPAYLGRALVLFRMGNEQGAKLNGEKAAALFKEQGNPAGVETSDSFLQNLQAIADARSQRQNSANLDRIVTGLAPIVLKFLLPLAGL